jgi:hypothetical protein
MSLLKDQTVLAWTCKEYLKQLTVLTNCYLCHFCYPNIESLKTITPPYDYKCLKQLNLFNNHSDIYIDLCLPNLEKLVTCNYTIRLNAPKLSYIDVYY